MKINSLNLINVNNNLQCKQKKLTFKAGDYFMPIKQIPGMVCACCGKKVLTADKLVKAETSISKPLSFVMEKGVFNYLKKNCPVVWVQLEEFVKKFPKLTLDEILDGEENENYVLLKQAVVRSLSKENLEPNTTERINLDRQIGQVFYDMLERGRSYMKSSAVVIKKLLPFKEYLYGAKKDAFEQLEIYSRKYPKKTLSEIIQIDSIKSFHTMKTLLDNGANREKMNYHFENIINLVKKENPSAVGYFEDLKREVIQMFSEIQDQEIRIQKAQDMYKKALKSCNCTTLEPQVMEELQRLPINFKTMDSFFVHAASNKYSDGAIISTIFGPVLATEEHIKTISEGGIDKVENKAVLHRECNNIRGRTSYSEFLMYKPQMPKYVQQQMDMITSSLLKNKLPAYLKFYPIKVAQNWFECSNGIIDLDIIEYCKKGLKASEKYSKELNAKIDALYNKRSELSLELIKAKKLREPVDMIIAQLDEARQEILKLKDARSAEWNLQRRMKEYLEKKE